MMKRRSVAPRKSRCLRVMQLEDRTLLSNANPPALLLLDPSGSGALNVTGNGGVQVTGGGRVVIDSSNASAAIITGQGNASAQEFDLTGGLSSGPGQGRFHGAVVSGEPAMADALANLPIPSLPSSRHAAVNYSGSAQLTLSPGTYVGGIRVSGSGSVMLQPGLYYLQGGGLAVTGGGSLTGTGVLIYNAPASTTDSIQITGTGSITLTPETSGAYDGIAIFQDRHAAAPISLTGGGSLNVTGTVYAAGAKLSITGNGGFNGAADGPDQIGSQVVVSDLRIAGNGGFQADATYNLPLTMTANVLPSPVVLSDGTLVTNVTDCQIAGVAKPGVPVQLETGGDNLFDEGATDADNTGSYSFPVTLLAGHNSLQVRAEDQFGDVATTTAQILLDTQPPTIRIASPATGLLTDNNITISGQVTDDYAGVASLSVAVDAGTYAPLTFDGNGTFRFPTAFPVDGSADGTHTIHFQATDLAGNTTGITDVPFTLEASSAVRAFELFSLTPEAAAVGTPTVVTATVRFGAEPTLLSDQIYLVQLDASGAPTTTISQMYDDGTHGDAVAADGQYTTQFTLNESSAAALHFCVRAGFGDAPTLAYSNEHTVNVALLPTASDVNLVLQSDDSIGQEFRSLVGSAGLDAARIQILDILGQDPDIKSAVLGPDGTSVDITYASGLTSVLLTAPADTLGAPDSPTSDSGQVLSFPDFAGHGAAMSSLLNSQTGVHSTTLSGPSFTLDAVANLASNGFIELITHGGVLANGSIIIATDELVEGSPGIPTTHLIDWESGNIEPVVPYVPLSEVWAFTPSFITAYVSGLKGSLVLATACDSLQNQSMADAFLSAGAGAYVGFTNLVYADFAFRMDTTLVTRMAAGDTVQAAFDQWSLSERTDPCEPHAVYCYAGDGNLALNLVKNGDFETGDFTSWTTDIVPTAGYLETYVLSSGNFGITILPYAEYVPHRGNYATFFGNAHLDTITQTISTVPGSLYLLSYWLFSDGGITNEFQVTWDGIPVSDTTDVPGIGYKHYTLDLMASATSTDLQFGGLNQPGWLILDDVTLVGEGQPQLLAVPPKAAGPGAGILTQNELSLAVGQATTELATAGFNVSRVSDVRWQISDLPDSLLGRTYGNTIWIDQEAAGYGWYTDVALGSDEAFPQVTAHHEREATPGSPAYGHVDLLTVVTHELGHILGLTSIEPAVLERDWMTATLGIGVRRYPDQARERGLALTTRLTVAGGPAGPPPITSARDPARAVQASINRSNGIDLRMPVLPWYQVAMGIIRPVGAMGAGALVQSGDLAGLLRDVSLGGRKADIPAYTPSASGDMVLSRSAPAATLVDPAILNALDFGARWDMRVQATELRRGCFGDQSADKVLDVFGWPDVSD